MNTRLQQRAQTLERELRTFRVTNVRAVTTTDNQIAIEGYASVSESPYLVRDFLGEYQETVQRGAFKKTLKEKDDVRLLFNHDGLPLARTKSGTMALSEDDTGLLVAATLDSRITDASNVVHAVERGDVDEMSFAFQATKQMWNEDYSERTIVEAKLFDVSVVTYPANPATSVKLRAADFVMTNFSERQASEFLKNAMTNKRAQIIVVDTDDDDEEDDDVLTCPSCGAGNEADAKYCDQCGAAIIAQNSLALNLALRRRQIARCDLG